MDEDDRDLWKRVAVGIALIPTVTKVSSAVDWADKIVEAYQKRKAESLSLSSEQ